MRPVIRLKYLVLVISFVGFTVLFVQNKELISQRMSRPVTKVRVENQWQRISEAEVRKLIGQFMGVGYFDFDVQSVKKELESHPWIRHAAVKKVWPDGVGLQLTEEVAIARWSEDRLLNQYGEIFNPEPVDHPGILPILSGPEGTQIQVMEQYRAINQLFFQAGLRVTGLALSERGNWTLELNQQIDINAGRVHVMTRLARFIDFYAKQAEEEIAAMAYVDLRYENGIAVRSHSEGLPGVAVR